MKSPAVVSTLIKETLKPDLKHFANVTRKYLIVKGFWWAFVMNDRFNYHQPNNFEFG
jgi:hypothetical protein